MLATASKNQVTDIQIIKCDYIKWTLLAIDSKLSVDFAGNSRVYADNIDSHDCNKVYGMFFNLSGGICYHWSSPLCGVFLFLFILIHD